MRTTQRGFLLFAVLLLSIAIEFTGPAIRSIGQWESTASDCVRIGISNSSEFVLPDGDLSSTSLLLAHVMHDTCSAYDPLQTRTFMQ